MGRKIKTKKLVNARLLKEYASWVYCASCGQTVAYLCYVAYDTFDFDFTCNCGCVGSVTIDFDSSGTSRPSAAKLEQVKNRLCCPADKSALLTLVEKNLKSYECRISCLTCGQAYLLEK